VAKQIKRSRREARAELEIWYLTDLRPKLASAARRGAVSSGAVAAFDLDLRRLLEISPGRSEEAA
jgi:hypothetical protein